MSKEEGAFDGDCRHDYLAIYLVGVAVARAVATGNDCQ